MLVVQNRTRCKMCIDMPKFGGLGRRGAYNGNVYYRKDNPFLSKYNMYKAFHYLDKHDLSTLSGLNWLNDQV